MKETATFCFKGTRVCWWGRSSFRQGKAAILIDGRRVGITDSYVGPNWRKKTGQWQSRLFVSDVLPAGEHTISIQALGEKYSESIGYEVVVDAFSYLPS
jgi:hypothetical protein